MASCQQTIYSSVFASPGKTRQNKWARYPEVQNNQGKQKDRRRSLYKNRKNHKRKSRSEYNIQTNVHPNTLYTPGEYHTKTKMTSQKTSTDTQQR
eukprot:15366374-Ditylum_brightwellii.AAC.1